MAVSLFGSAKGGKNGDGVELAVLLNSPLLLFPTIIMSKECISCSKQNVESAIVCSRCGGKLRPISSGNTIFRRATICVMVCLIALAGFYLSLIGSAKSLTYNDKQSVNQAIAILRQRGFNSEVMLLANFATFRSTDNWLNASVAKENAYAATNFPFEIVTLYPDFFTYPVDDTERAAILLHEAKHLAGMDEHDAYEFVWKNRAKLGWTSDKYRDSIVWQNIRRQTKDMVPQLFGCPEFVASDCTEAAFR